MAVGHWVTNRGKLLLAQGVWDDGAGTVIRSGLLVGTQPAGLDTEAEVQDISTVAALLTTGTGLATECTLAGYARQNLTRTAVAQDDTNNWADADASDISYGALPAGQTLIGQFFYDATTDTNDGTRQLISVEWFANLPTGYPTNGGVFSTPIADIYRFV